jgi:hypothetical protein
MLVMPGGFAGWFNRRRLARMRAALA